MLIYLSTCVILVYIWQTLFYVLIQLLSYCSPKLSAVCLNYYYFVLFYYYYYYFYYMITIKITINSTCHYSWLYVIPVSAPINALHVVRIMLTVLIYTKWSMMNAPAGWDFMVIFMVIFAWPTGGLFDGFGL